MKRMTKTELIDYLRMTLNMDNSNVVSDPAYKLTDDELYSILTVVTYQHNPSYTIETIPEKELHFAILLARREVYYRLASASAPLYPLEAEGASLRKDYRFTHYHKLIQLVTDQYHLQWEHFNNNVNFGQVTVHEVTIESKHFTERNYRLADVPQFEFTVPKVTDTWAGLDWTKPSNGLFSHYEVYICDTEILDEYSEELNPTATKLIDIRDIHKTKYKVIDLTPNTTYYLAVICYDHNGLSSGIEEKITTLQVEAPKE